MAEIQVRALKACFDNRNCRHEKGDVFTWSPRIYTETRGEKKGQRVREKMPDYLEPVHQADRERAEAERNAPEPLQGEARENAIVKALTELDAENDEHWTAEGWPRVEAVATLAGDETITRAEIKALSPDFMRPVD